MENETLETLIVRLRQYDPYPPTAVSETQHKIADELAPILAGLRELSRQWRVSRAHTYASENADPAWPGFGGSTRKSRGSIGGSRAPFAGN